MTAPIPVTPEQAEALKTLKIAQRQKMTIQEIPDVLTPLGLKAVVQVLLGTDFEIIGSPDNLALTERPDGQPLTADQFASIKRQLFAHNGNKVACLQRHNQARNAGGWTNAINLPMNPLSTDELGRALYYGYRRL